MKRVSKASLILILMFSLVCSPVLALNRNNTIPTINKFNGNPFFKVNTEAVLIAQTKKKGILERFGFKRKDRKPKQKQKRQGLFGFRRQQKPKVQQKQKRQGFLSRFRLKPNKTQKPKNQKRGFLQRFGFSKT